MLLLVSGSTRSVRDLAARWPDRLGHFTAPSNGNSIDALVGTGLRWAVDNGAYSGFDAAKFRRLLAKIAGKPRCLFVVCPDVVADAKATLARFREWAPEVRATGQKVAFVGQDGAEDMDLPWDDFDAWFVGGSTRWKLSQASSDLVYEARLGGKWCHMGRVNSLRRMVAAQQMGCQSIDGSSASMFGDKYIHSYCEWLSRLDLQPALFT